MQVGAESIAAESINNVSKNQFSTERSLERHETFGPADGLQSSRMASLEGGLRVDYQPSLKLKFATPKHY